MKESENRAIMGERESKIFAKNGVDDTTMNDIAVASKKGRRTLYTYFKSKEDIYIAVVESELELLSFYTRKMNGKNVYLGWDFSLENIYTS